MSEYEKRAKEIIKELYTHPDFVYEKWKRTLDIIDTELVRLLKGSMIFAHAIGRREALAEKETPHEYVRGYEQGIRAGRAEIIAEVMPVIEKIADGNLELQIERMNLQELKSWHLYDRIYKARALLAKLQKRDISAEKTSKNVVDKSKGNEDV